MLCFVEVIFVAVLRRNVVGRDILSGNESCDPFVVVLTLHGSGAVPGMLFEPPFSELVEILSAYLQVTFFG